MIQRIKVSSSVLSGAIWMPLGRLDTAMKTDFPVKCKKKVIGEHMKTIHLSGKPHSFGQPTIYRLSDILNGRSSNFTECFVSMSSFCYSERMEDV